MYIILKAGGFTTGGLNFDAHVRRQSIDNLDLFYAHIGAMDAFARGLKIASKLMRSKVFEKAVNKRYSGWDTDFGKKVAAGKMDFTKLEAYILEKGEPKLQSGRQELLENILNEYI